MKSTSPESNAGDSSADKAAADALEARAVARAARRRRHIARSRGAVTASVIALGLGGGVAGGALAAVMKDPDSQTAAPVVNKIAPQVNPRTLTGEAFALAASGTCLNWKGAVKGQPTDIFSTDCQEPHRFEVAERVDLTDKTPEDAHPQGATNVELAKSICEPVVNNYVQDRALDPEGRFAIALIPPSPEGWEAGDRSALCGIAAKDLDGSSAESVLPYAEADQHRRWEPGVCLGINDQRLPTAPVDCGSDHSIEIAANLDVTDIFPDGPEPPEPAQQTELTAQACYDAAVKYVGDAERLRRTTLIPTLVQPISAGSWATGSRTVNCGLMRAADPGPFAVLQGSARDSVRIEGEEPRVPTTTVVPAPSAPRTADDNTSGSQVPLADPGTGTSDTGTAGGAGLGIGPSGDGQGPAAPQPAPAQPEPAPEPAPAPGIPGLPDIGLFPQQGQ